MATLATLAASGYQPSPVPRGVGEVCSVTGIMLLTAAPSLNDILDMVKLPAGCVPVDVIVDGDDLDTSGSPALALDVGLITGTPGDTTGSRTCGSEFAAAAAFTGGGLVRATKQAGLRIVEQPVDRSVGIKIQAAAATFPTITQGTTDRGLWKPGTAYASTTNGDYVTLPDGTKMRCTTAGTSQAVSAGGNAPVTLQQPVWNKGVNLTTTDGTVTWTCVQGIIRLTLLYRSIRYGV